MRPVLALVVAAGLAASAFAFFGQPDPAAQPAAQPATTPPTDPAIPTMPPAPAKVPVPDMPVVKTAELEGGLLVEDLKIGDGYEVKEHGVVVAYYHGTLKSDGKIFDSAFDRGEPISFPLDGVIAGWQKGVPGMKVGGIRRLTIPSALGYGERGAGSDIPPNTDLVFVIQLVDALQMTDTVVGTGEEVGQQCVAVTAFTMKDSTGKEIEKSTAEKPYIWIPGEYQPIQFGLPGMKVGGKRTLIIPKEMNQTPPQVGVNRPNDIAVTMEIELLAVRNLGPMR